MSRKKRNPKKIRPYLNQIILKVNASFDWDAYKEDENNVEVVDALNSMKFDIVGDMPGTTEASGKKLLLALAYANRGDLQSSIPNGWTIAGFEGQKIVQNRVLSHLLPDYTSDVDENGDEIITEVPITDCTDRLCVLAGHKWTY